MAVEIVHGVRNDQLIEVAGTFLRAHADAGEIVVVGATRETADDFVRSVASLFSAAP